MSKNQNNTSITRVICYDCRFPRDSGNHTQCQTCANCGLYRRAKGVFGCNCIVRNAEAPRMMPDETEDYMDYMGMFGAHVPLPGAPKYLPSGAPGGASPSGGHATSFVRQCDHVQDPVAVGPYTIYLSGNMDLTYPVLKDWKHPDKNRTLQIPDIGIYLDVGWERKLELDKPACPPEPKSPDKPREPGIRVFGDIGATLDTSDLMQAYEERMKDYEAAKAAYELAMETWRQAKKEWEALPRTYRWPFIAVDWPDRGIVDVEVAERLVEFTIEQLQAGRMVDCGCAGSHGRTGTFLAMLLIDVEHLEPEEAIRQVRLRHCKRTIESPTQVRAIFGFGGHTVEWKKAEELAR